MFERLHKGVTIATRDGGSAAHFSALRPFSADDDAELEAIQYRKYV